MTEISMPFDEDGSTGTGRRAFLGTLLAGSLPFATGRAALPPGLRIAVVGAGMAGLAAVDRLAKAGAGTILVEARARTGGRIWTAAPGVDLGASWIHGASGNPLVALARATGTRRLPFDWNRYALHESGRRLADAEAAEFDTLLGRLWRHLSREGSKAGDGVALAPAIARFRKRLDPAERPRLDHVVNTNITHEFASDPARLSLGWFDEGAELRGGDQLLPAGYARLFSAFRQADETLFSTPVRSITYGDGGVNLTTDAGMISADAAIVTIPLGVLQRGEPAFDPPLPERHVLAIRRLGMGTLNKIYLRFPRVAWPNQLHAFGRVDRDRLWEEWVNLAPVTGKAALFGFNGGAVAERLEGRSNATIIASAMDALRRTFGRGFPSPVEARITRWHSDPWARGSYSNLAPGSSPRDRRALASPVHGRLLLAGEACSVESPSTVHGAYKSGIAAADALMATLS
jgi:monoamine oxidase